MAILAYQDLKDAVFGRLPIIKTDIESAKINKRIQPSSIDCVLSDHAYRVRSSFLPRENEKIEELIKKNYFMYDFEIKKEGKTLEKHCVYIIPLIEEIELPEGWICCSSPKSSTGRIDLFVRMLSDHCGLYDYTKPGYKGNLYLEMIPMSFAIKTSQLSFNQIRISTTPERSYLNTDEIILLHSKYCLAFDQKNNPIPVKDLKVHNNGLLLSVDLLSREIVGYKAKQSVGTLDLFQKNPKEDFFEPIYGNGGGYYILQPGEFYLFRSCERVRIPPEISGELNPYSHLHGELRAHYAGFFDNGFGYGENGELLGATAVFEVRANTVPFRITHGQVLGKMMYEKTLHTPNMLYGNNNLGSNYNYTEPKLGKYILGEW